MMMMESNVIVGHAGTDIFSCEMNAKICCAIEFNFRIKENTNGLLFVSLPTIKS
jgi:hypothetical protein